MLPGSLIMNSEKNQLLEEDRRSYFRVNDAVKISYHRIPKEELAERLDRLESEVETNFTVMSTFSALSQEISLQLRKIEFNAPDIALCIKALDDKLNILGRAFLAQGEDLTNQSAQPVNISAGGIALNSAEKLEIGTDLEIKILLLPAMTGLLVFGEVVGCETNGASDGKAYRYRLRIKFAHIREPDRDILIRHVLRRQGDWLRERFNDQEEEINEP
ncbi:hypothetical protein MNBD_GAMMA26-1733 [hydrothermal vent metagenome]|uniref:PilZ domain-containing protein n=1 Tax=hydrothermal vent metagenome TaxID=652676 RepID=A0A3B1B851_9ZZZZ